MQWKCLSQTSLGQTCVFGKFVSTVGRTNVFVLGKFVSTVGRTNVCVWEVRQYCRTVGRTNVCVWEVRQYCWEDKRLCLCLGNSSVLLGGQTCLCLGSSSVLSGGQTFVFGKFISTVGKPNVCVWEVRQYCWEDKHLCLGSSSVLSDMTSKIWEDFAGGWHKVGILQ